MKDISNLIGVPYSKLNCWGLIVEFYMQEFGWKLEKYYEVHDPAKNEVCSLIKANKKDFVRVDVPRYGDIVVLRVLGIESHLAVVVGDNLILHTQKKTGSVIDKLSRWKNLVAGYYRVKAEK